MKFIEDGNENVKFEKLFWGSLVIVKVSGQDSVNNGGYQVSVCVARIKKGCIFASCGGRTRDLKIMRLTRCQLRQRGLTLKGNRTVNTLETKSSDLPIEPIPPSFAV